MLWHRFGILGILSALLIVVWAVGFVAFGVHDGTFHLLLLVGFVSCVGEWVRRVAG